MLKRVLTAAIALTLTPPLWAHVAPTPPVHGRSVVTHHSVKVAGHDDRYTARAGTLILRNAQGEPMAKVFYIAYTLDGVRNEADRPITFAYNGGPGFASALVDFGGFGPRKIIWPHPGPGSSRAMAPPYRIVANPDTILPATDLVFIDAVGTGYSRIIGVGKPKDFYGIHADAATFAEFIADYLNHFGRWDSPKFLLGESYGTTRSAVLGQLLVAKGIYLNGIILCSTVLDFPTINFALGNDLPYELYLPSYAAVAWYHNRIHPQPSSLPAFVHAAEQFAAGPYAHALFEGARLGTAMRLKVARSLSRFTGIPVRIWLRANLRMTLPVFMRRVLGSAHATTGRYDARFSVPELQPLLPVGGRSAAGATTTAIWGALTATFESYVTRHLGFHTTHVYKQDSNTVFRDWNWKYYPPIHDLDAGVGDIGYDNVAPALARAMTNDPALELMANNGYFDLATPFYATHYTLMHMGLPARFLSHIHFEYYPTGHMLYLNPQAMPEIAAQMDHFIDQAAGR
ncbi:serine-type carboxypeptidase family protein [mine drainage metagenome]|uniref:Serine-type carboxypeptidase family protein n=3 Tax=mine drainage metagenome TaxID=410659 RepID=T0ZUS2_9ZZZZ